MIVFLNGPFGVGKTSAAGLLVERVPGAVLYDPEAIGSVLMRVFRPFGKLNDFQDIALWRTLALAGAWLSKKLRGRVLVIPMTVWRRDYFDSILAGLRRFEPDLSCFRLTASKGVLLRRISSDPQDTGAYGWRMSHADVCLDAFQDPAFGTEIRTDGRSPSEVADAVLRAIDRRHASRFPTADSRFPNG